MYKAGISIFNGLKDYDIDRNLEYLKKAKELGYEVVFSSAHINEASNSKDDFEKSIKYAKSLGLRLSLDISKPVFDKLPSLEDVYSLRLDYGFTEYEIVNLSKESKFLIELNASTITNDKFERMIENGLNLENVRVSFNYYPKRHTGNSIEFVSERTNYFHKYGIPVVAFIPSKIGFRPPMYEGLPTIEKHRSCSIAMAIEELKAISIDEIIFGDAYASEEELELLIEHNVDEFLIELKLVSELPDFYKKCLSNLFSVRIDSNDELIRLNGSEKYQNIMPFNCIKRKAGDVTIDNKDFLRYQGEINIVEKDLEQDNRVNVIGKLNISNIIIEKLKERRKIKFLINDND